MYVWIDSLCGKAQSWVVTFRTHLPPWAPSLKLHFLNFFLVCNISAHFKSNITYTFLLIASTSSIIMASAKYTCGAFPHTCCKCWLGLTRFSSVHHFHYNRTTCLREHTGLEKWSMMQLHSADHVLPVTVLQCLPEVTLPHRYLGIILDPCAFT